MNTTPPTDPLDSLLRSSLAARPPHTPPTDLAARAVAHATELERRATTQLARIYRWSRLCGLAAVLAIISTAAIAYTQLDFASLTTSATSVLTTASTSAESAYLASLAATASTETSSSPSTPLLLGLLAVALWLAWELRSLFTTEDLRILPSTPAI